MFAPASSCTFRSHLQQGSVGTQSRQEPLAMGSNTSSPPSSRSWPAPDPSTRSPIVRTSAITPPRSASPPPPARATVPAGSVPTSTTTPLQQTMPPTTCSRTTTRNRRGALAAAIVVVVVVPLLLAVAAAGSTPSGTDDEQPALPAAEQEAVYHVLKSVNPGVDWRYLYPDDLCLSGPHGIVCDLFSAGGGDGGGPVVYHVVELNFGYVSDFSPNPPCGDDPAFSPRLSDNDFPFLRKLFFYGCFNGSSSPSSGRTLMPESFWDRLPSSLEELVFVGNPSLGGRLSSRVGNLIRLRRFVLTGTRISGDIPDAFGNLRSLQQLVLSGNRLRGRIPSSLGRCEALKILDLSGNRIAGSLPPGLGRLKALVKLDLSGNRIRGLVPGEFADLRRLEFLDLSHNSLTGGVPTALAAMANLKEVYLSGNRLGGKIPEIWENLGGILGIGMSGTDLVGGIPASMGVFLGKLCYLGLDNNRLQGRVPEQFRGLEGTAREINLENNQLSGRVPFSAGFVVGVGGKLKLAGNPGLCLDKVLQAAAGGPEKKAGILGYLGLCNETTATPLPVMDLQHGVGAAAGCCRRPWSVFFLCIILVFFF